MVGSRQTTRPPGRTTRRSSRRPAGRSGNVPSPKAIVAASNSGVLERQREGVAEHELELDEIAGVGGAALNHLRRQVDGHDPPERPDPIGQDGGQLAGSRGDIDGGVAGPDAGGLDDSGPPAALKTERQDRAESFVDGRNLVEDRSDVGRRSIAPGGLRSPVAFVVVRAGPSTRFVVGQARVAVSPGGRRERHLELAQQDGIARQ